MKRLHFCALLCLLFLAACEDETTNESGFGSVIIHARLDTGGAAGGVETYIVRGSTDVRKTTDQSGSATYENVAAGSWDVGFFESSTYMFQSGAPSRKTVSVENDKTIEVELVVKRR